MSGDRTHRFADIQKSSEHGCLCLKWLVWQKMLGGELNDFYSLTQGSKVGAFGNMSFFPMTCYENIVPMLSHFLTNAWAC